MGRGAKTWMGMKPARVLRFTRRGHGWLVSLDGGEWEEVDVIELGEGCCQRVRLPSGIVGDDVGEAELTPGAKCRIRSVKDPGYPAGVKRVLVCKLESGEP